MYYDKQNYQIIMNNNEKFLTDKNQLVKIDLNKVFYGTISNYRYYRSVKLKNCKKYNNLCIEQIVFDRQIEYTKYTTIRFTLIDEDSLYSPNKHIIYSYCFRIDTENNSNINNRILYMYLILFIHKIIELFKGVLC